MTTRPETRFEQRSRRLAVVLLLALAGLTAVLGVLLQSAWTAKRQALQRSLQTAVALTAQELETGEMSRNATRLFAQVRRDTTAGALELDAWFDRDKAAASKFARGDSLRVVHFGRTIQAVADTVCDTLASGDDGITLVLQGERTRMVERVVGSLVQDRAPPLNERVSAATIDSVLTAQLRAAAITAAPRFAVVDADRGEVLLAGADGAPGWTEATARVRLFPLDLLPPHYDLLVDLPDARVVVLRRAWPLWAASAVFLLLTVLAFVRALGTMAQQRRAAAQLTAFINNMTHEFKTPLATVSLACEALARRAGDDPDAIRYVAMIRDENRRLGRQVEHVLQMAQLERGELRRGTAVVDMTRVLARAAAAFALQAEAARGRLVAVLPDRPASVLGDETHLAVVVDNLLDNAVKYADGPPRIELRGEVRRDGREGDQLIITVRDEGPGIPAADHDRVFDPYFRGATGDRHDVKGFGLGLSFVRLVAELHLGSVKLHSRPGAGTTVTVRLPLLPDASAGA